MTRLVELSKQIIFTSCDNSFVYNKTSGEFSYIINNQKFRKFIKSQLNTNEVLTFFDIFISMK
ncbi:hypothetical protein [Fusobacterium periodonticum]|uniref:hypothetical protein n=1 Tax=Fusobacterium periodonticum TaxID=860 RepID=UPI0001BCB136|nr:hypothetical protein [Fusobacterium periodonticum]